VINKWAYIRGGGGAYIWNEVSVSTCGGLIFGGGGGGYIRRFMVVSFNFSIKQMKVFNFVFQV
jgi:hypothetical protein